MLPRCRPVSRAKIPRNNTSSRPDRSSTNERKSASWRVRAAATMNRTASGWANQPRYRGVTSSTVSSRSVNRGVVIVMLIERSGGDALEAGRRVDDAKQGVDQFIGVGTIGHANEPRKRRPGGGGDVCV